MQIRKNIGRTIESRGTPIVIERNREITQLIKETNNQNGTYYPKL